MGDIIDFPCNGESDIKKALAYFRDTYAIAGLSESEIELAINQFEPILRQFIIRKEFELNLNHSFDQEQFELFKSAHNETMQNAIKYFSSQLWLALCNIAGLIGRDVQNS